jgi:hypothetical protein
VSWHTVSPTGADRDLWVHVTGDGRPEYGRWLTPSGLDVARTLDRQGPPGVDVDVRWVQAPGHRGQRLTDFVWETGLSGLKLVSQRLVRTLTDAGATLEVFDAEVRLRSGEPVEGYVAVLEPCLEPEPVHSLRRGRRDACLVVSGEVASAIEEAGLTGLDVEPVAGPFPGDDPGHLDD